jgi:Bacterial aa3 type cytochrome c oxidase subunit IV
MDHVTQIHETSEDFHAHRATYDGFLRISVIGAAWVLCIVVTLAIGGTTHRWFLGSFYLFLSTIASVVGMAVKGWDWRPGAVMVVLGLLILLLINY